MHRWLKINRCWIGENKVTIKLAKLFRGNGSQAWQAALPSKSGFCWSYLASGEVGVV